MTVGKRLCMSTQEAELFEPVEILLRGDILEMASHSVVTLSRLNCCCCGLLGQSSPKLVELYWENGLEMAGHPVTILQETLYSHF